MVQWLRLQVSNEGGTGLIPGQGTKIPHVAPHSQKHTHKWEAKGSRNLYITREPLNHIQPLWRKESSPRTIIQTSPNFSLYSHP